MELTVDQVLDRAADIVDARGWHRGSYGNLSGGEVCIVGAVYAVCGPTSHTVSIVNSVLFRYFSMTPWVWNDFKCQDRYEATAALRQAAKVYREEQG